MPAPVVFSGSPPDEAWTTIIDYSGGSSPIYTGLARSFESSRGTQGITTYTVTSVSKANPAIVTITAHGIWTGTNGFTVTIAGGTGDWAGINGIQAATVTGANTFTIPVDTSGYAGSFSGTITTSAPLTSQAIWSIQKTVYSGSSPIAYVWASGKTSDDQIWDNRATLAYQ